MTELKYLALVEDMFSVDGALVQAGGRHNSHQQEYAGHIAKIIISKQSVGLCEAATGIGKSLAYLIPALVYLSNNPESLPIAVSTHTRALQRQLLDKDIPLAVAALEKQGIAVPSIAFRMGRQAFFSPSRVDDLIKGLSAKDITPHHEELSRYAQASAVSGTGLWMDYIDKYASFPEGITANDICLLDIMESDSPAYTHHLELAKTARLLVTNHATIMSHNVFKASVFHTLLCDEAHEIEDVCKDLSTYKSQLKRLSSAISATNINTASVKKACQLSESIADQLRDFDTENKQTRNLISDITNSDLLNNLQPDVLQIKKYVQSIRNKFMKGLDAAPTNSQARVIDRLDRHLQTLKAFESGTQHSQRRAAAFSDYRREPSIASISLTAGRLFSYRANLLTDRFVLISATMANANTKSLCFSQIYFALGLDESRITEVCSLAPANFGKMSFVVAPQGKSPIKGYNDNAAELDESWIVRTSKMIDAAAETGKTLVLSPSIKESELFAKQIESDYLLQDARTSLMQLTSAFVKGDEPVLLSAGAWNGVSLRSDDGGQLIKNIVITRIPFLPVDEAMQFLQREYLLSKGYTESAIKSIYWTAQQYHAMIKLKQGIGRGLRAPTDDIKIWFADPRMPTQKKSSGLIAAIPRRFLDDYYTADIFDGEEITTPEPILFL